MAEPEASFSILEAENSRTKQANEVISSDLHSPSALCTDQSSSSRQGRDSIGIDIDKAGLIRTANVDTSVHEDCLVISEAVDPSTSADAGAAGGGAEHDLARDSSAQRLCQQIASARTEERVELLLEQYVPFTDFQSKLRVIWPGVSQMLIWPQALLGCYDEQSLLHNILRCCRQLRCDVSFGTPESYIWRMHVKQPEIRASAYLTIAEFTSDPRPFFNFYKHAQGGKLRAVPKDPDATHVQHLTMRALRLSALIDFDAKYTGSDSRQKQDQLLSPFRIEGSGEMDADDGKSLDGRLARLLDGQSERAQWGREIDSEAMYEVFYLPSPRPRAGWGARRRTRLLGKFLRKNPQHCEPGLSYVESAAVEHAGAPDIMISYSWQLDWRYMVAFLRAAFDTHVMVWLDILACAQLRIEEGDLSEIEQLPEVVNFAGKTVVMPGVLNRMWCIYEFAWSIECNGGSLFYGYNQGKVTLDDADLQKRVEALYQTDKRILLDEDDSKFLDQASCFKENDQAFIKETIRRRLGGQDQVTLIVKERLRAAMSLNIAEHEPQTDREALTLFFRQSDGPNWKNKELWLEKGVALSAWHGIATGNSSDDKVTQLKVRSVGIATVGAAIGYLDSLTNLDLSENTMEGLPETIGKLKNLQSLYLVQCSKLEDLPQMDGCASLLDVNLESCEALTADVLREFCAHPPPTLQKLNLSRTNLEGLPNTIGDLKNLQDLSLSKCGKLEVLPDTIGDLKNLQNLGLCLCKKLQGLPDTIGDNRNLQDLNLESCSKLKGLPDTIGDLKNLQDLNLCACVELEGLPKTIGELESLQTLHLAYCEKLKGLPETVGKLENLQGLNLEWCKNLRGLPKTIGKLENLKNLNLYGCEKLKGLPNTIGDLKNLQDLNLFNCSKLEGLPDTIGDLKNLQDLNLYNCRKLEGLPDTIGDLKKLQNLDLTGCEALTGLPETIGKLENLQKLDLSYCWQLEGLSETVGQLENLQSLNLKRCRNLNDRWYCADGHEFEAASGITSLFKRNKCAHCKKKKSQHRFVSGLPETLYQLPLKNLNIGDCKKLSLDTVDHICERLTQLEGLVLAGLEITGLPKMDGCASLLDVNLESCKALTADGLRDFCAHPPPTLQKLNLSWTDLEGLPDTIGKLEKLQNLKLKECYKLQGLPVTIGDLKNLQNLKLENCRALTGIPDTIGDLKNLQDLNLGGCTKLEVDRAKLKAQLPNCNTSF